MEKKLYMQWLIYAITLCAGLGGILYGYDIGVISGALPLMQKEISLSLVQQEIIVGAVLAGSLISTLFAGIAADQFGRKNIIIVACLIFIIALCLILHAHQFEDLLIARLLLGVAVGIISVVIPLYLTEIAPAHLRGRSVTMFQIFLTFGIMLAYLVDLLFTHLGDWRGMFAVIFVPVIILFVSMLILPETPRWLMSQGKTTQAKNILDKLRPAQLVEIEMKCIEEGLHTTQSHWRELLSKNCILPLTIALTIAVCNQLTGINVILQYAPMVMQSAGLSSSLAQMMATFGIGALNFIGTLVAMMLVDVVGRKRLLMIGTGGVVLMNFYLGICSFMFRVGPTQATFVLFGLLIYIVAFAIGPGVIVWLAISELLPTKVRGKSISLCLFVNFIAGTALSSCFLSIQKALGMGMTYWLFSACTVIYFIVAKYWLPETNGRDLEDIQKSYQAKVMVVPEVA